MRIDRLSSFVHLLASCLVGGRCPGCRARMIRPLCGGCRAELAATPPAPDAALQDEGVAGRIARRAKHGQWRAAPLVLAPLLVDRLGGVARIRAGIDLLSWVPADGGRRRQRGGHLPEQLARSVGRRAGVRVGATLERTRSRAQRGLDEHARARNVRGMFRVRRVPVAARASGARPVVLLLDDVRTTGSTLAEAARLLEAHGCFVLPYALVGVPRRDEGATAGCDISGQGPGRFSRNSHNARKTHSRTGLRLPITRSPLDESEPRSVQLQTRSP